MVCTYVHKSQTVLYYSVLGLWRGTLLMWCILLSSLSVCKISVTICMSDLLYFVWVDQRS